MDGEIESLPVRVWFAIGISALIGSLMFGFVRPHPTKWTGVAITATSTGAGLVLTLGTCHWFGVVQETQFMVVAFLIGLFVMPLVSAAVSVAEKDGQSWVKSLFARIFGSSATQIPPVLDSSDDGSDK